MLGGVTFLTLGDDTGDFNCTFLFGKAYYFDISNCSNHCVYDDTMAGFAVQQRLSTRWALISENWLVGGGAPWDFQVLSAGARVMGQAVSGDLAVVRIGQDIVSWDPIVPYLGVTWHWGRHKV